MLNKFIYVKTKSLFEEALTQKEVSNDSIVFIEDTKQIWNHGTYFDCTIPYKSYERYLNLVNQRLDLKVNLNTLNSVAFTGSYNDLINKPTIPEAQVNSDWNATSGKSQILNKPDLSTKQDTITDLETIRQNSNIGANSFKWSVLEDILDVFESVDLGLPSGTLWATHNVGATKPEEYGGYYAWGETEEKSNYDWSTYKWCDGSSKSLIKYCTNSSYGTVDNKTILDPEDDVVLVKWGGNWRMPTLYEQQELLNNCTWQWTTQNGVQGYIVTGPNGNSIFLPAAGCRSSTDFLNKNTSGYYWSSSLRESDNGFAYGLSFDSSFQNLSHISHHLGCSVRPVYKINTVSVEGETLIISSASYSNETIELQGAKVEDEILVL